MTKKEILLKFIDVCIKNAEPAICFHYVVNNTIKFEIYDNEYFPKLKKFINREFDCDLALNSVTKYKQIISYFTINIDSYESILNASNEMQEWVENLLNEEDISDVGERS